MSGFHYELEHIRDSEDESASDSESCYDNSNEVICAEKSGSNESDVICTKLESATSSSQIVEDKSRLSEVGCSPPWRGEEKTPNSAVPTALKQTKSIGKEIVADYCSKTRPAQRRTLLANFDLDDSDDEDAQD
jgi:hypothetical protein